MCGQWPLRRRRKRAGGGQFDKCRVRQRLARRSNWRDNGTSSPSQPPPGYGGTGRSGGGVRRHSFKRECGGTEAPCALVKLAGQWDFVPLPTSPWGTGVGAEAVVREAAGATPRLRGRLACPGVRWGVGAWGGNVNPARGAYLYWSLPISGRRGLSIAGRRAQTGRLCGSAHRPARFRRRRIPAAVCKPDPSAGRSYCRCRTHHSSALV